MSAHFVDTTVMGVCTVETPMQKGIWNIIGETLASIEFVIFRTGKYSKRNITGETPTTSVNFRTDLSFLNAATK